MARNNADSSEPAERSEPDPVDSSGSSLGCLFDVLMLPIHIVQGVIGCRVYWANLRRQGRVVDWREVEQRVSDASGTLVVEWWPKGPSRGWLIETSRNHLDPDHVAPTWGDFEKRGRSVFARSNGEFEPLNRWSVEHLQPRLPSARMLAPTLKQLRGLAAEVKATSVLVVYWLCDGCLDGEGT